MLGEGRLEDKRSGDGLDVKSNVRIFISEVVFGLFSFLADFVIDGFGSFGDIEDGFRIVGRDSKESFDIPEAFLDFRPRRPLPPPSRCSSNRI